VIFDALGAAREPVRFTTFDAWWAQTASLRAHEATVDRAIELGFAADRLGMAFAGAYCSAMVALGAPDDGPSALCATEDEGGHPRAIKTRLEAGRVTGTKRFVSFGTFAKTLLVVASEGVDEQGRNRLRVVQVAAREVKLEAGVELPFVPEVPHASVVLENVAGQVLPGDGYERYLKPFRTIEDLHVNAAVLAYLLNVGLRFGWSTAVKEDLLAGLASAVTLGSMDPSSVATHRVIAGLLGNATRIIDGLDWSNVEPDERARFERDRPLLKVAAKARLARQQKAWG
jgi:alkylation response protein AidB-like acyl-CoA dehydrogenase